MKDFSRIQLYYFSKQELAKINKTKLLIIGCGGLGSNIANILVRTGFSDIVLADFDRVEMKNLNRQLFFPSQQGEKKVLALKKNILKINPHAKVKTIFCKIYETNIAKIIIKEKINIIIEAVDNEDTKKMIFEEALKLKKKIVSASGVAGFGDCEKIIIKRGKNFVVVGDMTKSIKDFKPLAPKVAAVAAIQADEVLRMVLNDE